MASHQSLALVSATHTEGHIDCPVCDRYRQANMRSQAFGSLQFSEAFEYWLNGRKSISSGTHRDYRNCGVPLKRFFGQLRLVEIHAGHLQSYQDERHKTVGPVRINRELGVVLGGILDRAGLWDDIKKFYEPLPLSKKRRGIALEPEEEKYLWKIASGKPRWAAIYYAIILGRNTCMRSGEIRQLRLSCIDQKDYSWIKIQEFVKNEFSERTITCNPDAAWALQKLCERAASLGAYMPDHYLMPHKADPGQRNFNVSKPQHDFYTAWASIRREVAKKFPHLAKMRPTDAGRHTGFTRLMENPAVPYNAAAHMMGHEINSKMKRFYDHLRDITLHKASEALASGHYEAPEERTTVFVERKKPACAEVAQTIENKKKESS